VKRDNAGFSLVEVLVAVTVLGVGVVALAGASALTTRMIGRGRTDTRAAQVATSRLEWLRLQAYSTDPRCTVGNFASGGPVTTPEGVTESWTVDGPGVGTLRKVRVNVSYRAVRGTRTDSLVTRIEC
jgi:prepilin-type N-terminal cleavage/methylation domain-containing protein